MSVWTWIVVAVAGGTGAVARFLLDGLVAQRLGRDLPFGTLTINLSGAFMLGLLTGAMLRGDAMLLAGTAAIGSYTTFSTWMLETHRLAEDGAVPAAAANLVVGIIAGVAAAALGRLLGGQL